MPFTGLHRAAGAASGPLADSLLDDAVAAGARESVDLDWKSELPPIKNLSQSDFPKDVAAMANAGGGVIVYGVREADKAATGRVHVAEFHERYESALVSAAVTAISPPVLGLRVHSLGQEPRAVVVEVPSSVDGPHLIYRNDFFGAPLRNDSDTVWMREREVARMYRARFDEQRRAIEALGDLFAYEADGRDVENRAWLVAVGLPRRVDSSKRISRDDTVRLIGSAESLSNGWTRRGMHPLASTDRYNVRPGLRRWIAPNSATGNAAWREAWVSVHHNGAVSVAAAVGGHRNVMGEHSQPWVVESVAVENAVSDFLALIRTVGLHLGGDEYDIRIGIESRGLQPLRLATIDSTGYQFMGTSTALHRYAPVDATIQVGIDDRSYEQQLIDLATDCINQGGITYLQSISEPG
ncbi:AlbA family DNA-binding domain-containing protein [Curtobacterium poinsettiae]|uniref:ATP-binding protein n=1 Tax=Curtobacterium poinsettiae TaxID=159612 RepID=A0A9Q9T3R7_9MICO|nr:ATP-binding protein [Curtobacterium flaccumfaciens]UYC81398.1 ATP-binding protein [Curtobacterium flaccumfaciens pv. poinsettiae]